MTDAPLSPADEAAVQLIVNTIIGRARMEEAEPGWSNWDAENMGFACEPGIGLTSDQRWLSWDETLCLHKWLGAKIRGVPDTPLASLGACRGGPTLALSDVANGVEEECILCGMIVRADQVEHPVFGFKARCEGK